MATSSQSFPIRPASRSSGPPSISATSIPDLFTSQPIIRDPLETSTSNIQDETVRECLPYLRGNSTRLDYNRHGVPNLTREKHKNFLKRNLRKLPAPFIAADASRPWMLLWNLAGLALLDEDISSYGPVLVDTALTMQNRSGGFGGGHGQSSHLATTFACVLALACCGTQEAYDIIDRRSLWKWLCSLKQPNGGFQITFGGEVDVRYVLALPVPRSSHTPHISASVLCGLQLRLPNRLYTYVCRLVLELYLSLALTLNLLTGVHTALQ